MESRTLYLKAREAFEVIDSPESDSNSDISSESDSGDV